MTNPMDKEYAEYITNVLDIMAMDGMDPVDAEATVTLAAHRWAQDYSTAWQSYAVDGYSFSVRRDEDGSLLINKYPSKNRRNKTGTHRSHFE